MKDRCLFKAKICNGEWVAGFLHCKDDKWYISNKAGSPFAYEVRPDTICQCTGLRDKNGKLIWENDVIKYHFGNAYAQYQIEEHIKAVVNLFHYTLINGDATTTASTDHPEFQGLDSMLAGTTTEYGTDKAIDLSSITAIKSNADEFYEALSLLVKTTDADAVLTNTEMITKIQTVARILGYKTESEEAFGKRVTTIDGVKLVDMQDYYTVSGGSATAGHVVKKGLSRTIAKESSATTGLTDVYAVKFDVNDGFHGISLNGGSVIDQYLPNFNEPGTVKDAEVEMIAATVLKNTQHAGVLRNIKIA